MRKKRNGQFDCCVDEWEHCLASTENVESTIETKELTKVIEGFLDTLSEENRLIFIRRYWYMDSYDSIAQMTGMRENAVRTRLSRTRAGLRKYLQERGAVG